MAHARMPRGNATAWVSKPRHRSPPIRPGENPPGRTMASRYSAPANCREHVIPVRQAKGAKPDLKKDQHPVSATTRTRLHLLSRKPTFQEVQISPAKSNPSAWRGTSRPNPASIKNQKNTLIRSDTTDPVHASLCHASLCHSSVMRSTGGWRRFLRRQRSR